MAADMWSIGIISALLLSGEFIFEDSMNGYGSPATILNAAAECNLVNLDHSPPWLRVNSLAKDLVRKLLILDEKARLNVEQALEHGWFTHSTRRKYIQQQYEDVTRGWMPSRPLLDFKEDLTMFREASKYTLDVRPLSA